MNINEGGFENSLTKVIRSYILSGVKLWVKLSCEIYATGKRAARSHCDSLPTIENGLCKSYRLMELSCSYFFFDESVF